MRDNLKYKVFLSVHTNVIVPQPYGVLSLLVQLRHEWGQQHTGEGVPDWCASTMQCSRPESGGTGGRWGGESHGGSGRVPGQGTGLPVAQHPGLHHWPGEDIQHHNLIVMQKTSILISILPLEATSQMYANASTVVKFSNIHTKL